MILTRTEVQQIATLAKLPLDEVELDAVTRELGSILDHMRDLSAAPSHEVPPMYGISEHPAPFREDQPGADPLLLPIDAFAPGWEEHFFVVPRLAALDADVLAAERGAL